MSGDGRLNPNDKNWVAFLTTWYETGGPPPESCVLDTPQCTAYEGIHMHPKQAEWLDRFKDLGTTWPGQGG